MNERYDKSRRTKKNSILVDVRVIELSDLKDLVHCCRQWSEHLAYNLRCETYRSSSRHRPSRGRMRSSADLPEHETWWTLDRRSGVRGASNSCFLYHFQGHAAPSRYIQNHDICTKDYLIAILVNPWTQVVVIQFSVTLINYLYTHTQV